MTEVRPFQLLSDRLAGLPIDQTLHDDVPDWLDKPLRDWLHSLLMIGTEPRSQDFARRVLMRLRWTKDNPQQSYLTRLELADQTEMLTVVDAVLQLHHGWDYPRGGVLAETFAHSLASLDDILTDGGSLYRVDLSEHCLVCRVDVTVQDAVDAAVAATNSTTADHLRTAWVATYGLHPDPDKAYDHAVLALEDLLCPLVCPRNNRATPGVVISDLRNQAAQWELSVENTSAGNPNSRQQTQTEAEAAIHMAAALTQWLTAGVLHRKT